MKTIFDRLISGGLGGTAQGMFVTLIIGTVAEQLGGMLSGISGGPAGQMVTLIGRVLTSLMGAGIGIAIARKLAVENLVTVSAGIAGMVGAQAEGIISGSLFADGGILIAGAGEPLAAFAAAYVAVELGTLIAGKTRLDPILVPILCIGAGSIVALFAGPYISSFSSWLGWLVSWCAGQHPFLMGVTVSLLACILSTLPFGALMIFSAVSLNGAAAGAAAVGCCCSMVGFAAAGYRENGISGLIVQGLGTSMVQTPNIIRRPVIWLPELLSAAILGPLSTLAFGMTGNALGAAMGTAGLIGPLTTWQIMTGSEQDVIVLVKIILIQFILPAVLSLLISGFMMKRRWIRSGDMKLQG